MLVKNIKAKELRVLAVVIRELNKGFGAREFISHEGTTAPIYKKRAAIFNAILAISKRTQT